MLQKKTLGYAEGWASVVINTSLFGLKFWIGTIIGSVAMVADAWHTLSDTLTSVIVIFGFWMASLPADREHPFGHGRAEPVGSVAIAVLLGVVGFYFLKESVGRLLHYQYVGFQSKAIVIFGISVLLKEALARFSFWAGRKIDSNSLKADGWHHRSDAIASALIVVGAFFGKSLWWIDGAMGIGVSLLILYAAYDILKSSTSHLLGEVHRKEVEVKVAELVGRVSPQATRVHHVHMHRYGDHIELTLHINMPKDTHLDETHRVATEIERLVNAEMNIEATVHVEPAGIFGRNRRVRPRIS
jgi:cation diffusion facilitator family transporter